MGRVVSAAPTTRKKAAKPKRLMAWPRRKCWAAPAPCCRCAKAASTDPKTGKGVISPLSWGPRTEADVVRENTKAEATIIRAGMSQRAVEAAGTDEAFLGR